MPLTADRRDFVEPDTYCDYRSTDGRRHRLDSGTAYVLKDEAGVETVAGRCCALRALGHAEALRGIPDFTTREPGDDGAAQGVGGGGDGHGPDGDEARVIAAKKYLHLRIGKLAPLPGASAQLRSLKLEDIHVDFRASGRLSEGQIRYVVQAEAKCRPEVRTTNLLDVYTAHHQLLRLLREAGARGPWLRSVHEWLLARLYLSPKQIEKAGLKLHPRAFAWKYGDTA